jgi:hypothetical protein
MAAMASNLHGRQQGTRPRGGATVGARIVQGRHRAPQDPGRAAAGGGRGWAAATPSSEGGMRGGSEARRGIGLGDIIAASGGYYPPTARGAGQSALLLYRWV